MAATKWEWLPLVPTAEPLGAVEAAAQLAAAQLAANQHAVARERDYDLIWGEHLKRRRAARMQAHERSRTTPWQGGRRWRRWQLFERATAAGVDVNRPAEIGYGSTALMIAAHMGGEGNTQELKAFINTLFEAGADVNVSMTDEEGKKWQALTSALEGLGGLTGESGPPGKGPGQLEAIRLLLATGKVEQEHLSAARDMAIQMGHREAMELLA